MRKLLALNLIAVMLLSACGPSIPRNALSLSPESLGDRQMQTRRFDTTNYEVMLSAASAVFQDLGFTLDESEYSLGVLVGSKQRDASSASQIAGALLLGILTGATSAVDDNQVIRVSIVMREIHDQNGEPAATLSDKKIDGIRSKIAALLDKELRDQLPAETSKTVADHLSADMAKILKADFVRLARASGAQGSSTVRVTFQRIIYDNRGQVSRKEQINEAQLYQEFFDKLSQAVFLEAHEI